MTRRTKSSSPFSAKWSSHPHRPENWPADAAARGDVDEAGGDEEVLDVDLGVDAAGSVAKPVEHLGDPGVGVELGGELAEELSGDPVGWPPPAGLLEQGVDLRVLLLPSVVEEGPDPCALELGRIAVQVGQQSVVAVRREGLVEVERDGDAPVHRPGG
jgi:hypothetical protein